MEGLSITVLPLSKIRFENRVFRYDTQYYDKKLLAVEGKLKRGNWELLIKSVCGIESFGAYALTNQYEYVEDGMPFLRCLNIRNGFTDFTDVLYVPYEAEALLAKSAIKPGMVLLTMSGSVGNVSVALPEWKYPINSNQDIAKITPCEGTSPFFLMAFLSSEYGCKQMARLPVGSVQQHIFLWMIEQLIVTRFSPELEQAISGNVETAYITHSKAINRLAQAETILLQMLNLDNWQPSRSSTYTCRASEAFAAGRLDSDYFAPQVTELLERLNADHLSVRDVAPLRQERFDSASGGEFDYLEISGMRGDGTVTGERLPCSEAPSRATWYVRTGDVITSTVRPIRRLSAIITPEQDGFVCSSGFAVLRPEAVSPELLLTYLRLPPICALMDLHTSASLYPAISERDILGLPFRRVSPETEAVVVAAVRGAHAARRAARALLERAKRAVEVAIEDSEAAALDLLAPPLEP